MVNFYTENDTSGLYRTHNESVSTLCELNHRCWLYTTNQANETG